MSILHQFRLDGRRAFVTGASRGIGRAIAAALAEAGADVALAARDRTALEAVAAHVRSLGRRAHVCELDVSRLEAIGPAVDRAAEALGGLDILVNNAGVTSRVRTGAPDPAEFDRVFDTNLGAVIFAAQAARPWLAASPAGVVVNIGSIAAPKGVGIYGASKAAVHSLTRGMSREYADEGIRSVALAPGQVDTDMTARARADVDERRRLLHHTARRRAASPWEIAAAVVFAASPAADFISGAVIAIDGGRDYMPPRPDEASPQNAAPAAQVERPPPGGAARPGSFRLDGRRALITGASRGIGRAAAQAFARAGASLALAARQVGHLDPVMQTVRAHGVQSHAFGADLADAEAPARLVRQAAAALGGLDILVNNAGIGGAAASPLTVQAYRRLLHVNLRAPVYAAQAAHPFLRKSPAPVVVNMSSVAARLGGLSPYGSCKAALSSYTVGLARDWGPQGIRALAIAPGVIDTDMTAHMIASEDFSRALRSRVGLARVGRVDELAAVTQFLASDAASYVTGVVIPADGGWVYQY